MGNGRPVNQELFENLRLELRRGCLIVAALAHLRSEHYGYTLRKALVDYGLAIDEGTLYPLLRRLETQGLLLSEWREENKRNKRFYRLSPDEALWPWFWLCTSTLAPCLPRSSLSLLDLCRCCA